MTRVASVMMVRRLFLSVAVGLLALGAGLAPSAAQSPEAFVRIVAQRAIDQLSVKDLLEGERESRFRALLNEHFDIHEIGRFALGLYWRQATDQQKAEYQKLFEEFVVQSYSHRFKDYSGEQFRVTQVVDAAGSDKLVQTEIVRPHGNPIRLNWRVRPSPNSFRIVDVVLEGISMSTTQRDEFAAVIRQNGGKVDGLLAALRKKTGKG